MLIYKPFRRRGLDFKLLVNKSNNRFVLCYILGFPITVLYFSSLFLALIHGQLNGQETDTDEEKAF